MKKTVFTMAILMGALLMSCNNNRNRSAIEEVDVIEPDVNVTPDENIVNTTVRDNNGNTLVLTFDNLRGTATATLNGEAIQMTRDTTASGIRMHNDNYTYEEWQGHIVLAKDGDVVFDNRNELRNSATNAAGQRLDMDFNNNNNTAVMNYGGETVVLNADTTASGIRYSNADYTYEEWQGHIILKRNGQVIFDNRK